MSYVNPTDLVKNMIDAGEAKILMSTRDTLIRAFMAGAILALSAAFAVTVTAQTNEPLAGALLFPVGFCILYLLGFDLLTGVFTLAPPALIDNCIGLLAAYNHHKPPVLNFRQCSGLISHCNTQKIIEKYACQP